MNAPLTRILGRIGRSGGGVAGSFVGFLQHITSVWALFLSAMYWGLIAPFQGRNRIRAQLMPMFYNVGVRSSPIVALISLLIGAILVIQTGDLLRQYGQAGLIPEMVALAIVREFGPVMTAIIVTARVGASFTAVLASMKINDEVMALETMAISPTGFLVAPRLIAMAIMVPSLTVLSYVIGMVGGAVAAGALFDIPAGTFAQSAIQALKLPDVLWGVVKGLVFSILICLICCYYGLTTTGGAMGLGRNTMVAVVTSLVAVIASNMILGIVFVKLL